MKFKLLLLGLMILLIDIFPIFAQPSELYRIYLKEKKYQHFNATDYFSIRALNRRKKFEIYTDMFDIPINRIYLDSITSCQAKIICTSRWMNTVVVQPENELTLNKIKNFPFITRIVKVADSSINRKYKKNKFYPTENSLSFYDRPLAQIALNKGDFIHTKGYLGREVIIAVIDAGFKDATKCFSLKELFDENRIIDTKDFVYPSRSVFEGDAHGTAVLSIMASNGYGGIWGSAPLASYILLRSEDVNAEYPAEEDFWVAAAEYADSLGADIINSSLGYTVFDNLNYNYSYKDMDGKTTFIAQAASIAASRGIIVVVSAGNDGNKSWRYIGTPADAKNILTVGAVNSSGVRAYFSSIGPSFDGRVKPEIMAMGVKVFAEFEPNNILQLNGTSFSAPIISGLLACILEAFPNIKPEIIRNNVIRSSNHFLYPDSFMGFGIPNFEFVFQQLQNPNLSTNEFEIYPNPCSHYIHILWVNPEKNWISIKCFSSNGLLNFSLQTNNSTGIMLKNEIISLPSGMYYLQLIFPHKSTLIKFIKI